MRVTSGLIACAFFLGMCASADPEVGLELLPTGRPFRRTFADPREIRMALSFEGGSRLDARIGNYFSLLAIEPTEPLWSVHFGLEGAGFFTMRQAHSRFPLETVDGMIGLYFEGALDIWQAQLRYTHVSAHLADGVDNASTVAIPYSRETLSLRFGVVPSPNIHVYTGIHYLANTVPKLKPWALQVGAAYFLDTPPMRLAPFVATDIYWRQAVQPNPSISLQIGLALNNPPEVYRSFRFYYSYYTGVDVRGQYYSTPTTSHSFGIEMQI